jgi:LTXXQ motif family protein
MQLCLGHATPQRAALPQLEALESDLGITSYQKGAWDFFVRTLEAIADALSVVEREMARDAEDHTPSLPLALRHRAGRLAAELEATQVLQRATERLYRMLTPQQRTRADRMFPRLSHALGWDGRPIA